MNEKTQKPEMEVVVLYSGSSGWALNYPKKGMEMLGPGDTKTLKLNNVFDLRILLQIIKQINAKDNVREYKPKGGLTQQVKRFEITNGEDLIPTVLRKHRYGPTLGFTAEEEKAITSLCPDFFDEKYIIKAKT
jgi:hypothetical protein